MSISEPPDTDQSMSAARLRQMLSRSPLKGLAQDQARSVLTRFVQGAAAERGRTIDDVITSVGIDHRVARQVFLTAGAIPSWHTYVAVLEALGVDPMLINQVRGYWRAAEPKSAAPKAATTGRVTALPRLHQPAVPTKDDEICAATPGEFADLLKLLRVRSGVGPSEISRRTGIARSQVYELIKSGRSGLPTRADQVVAFARACGLCPDKIAILRSVWAELAEKTMLGDDQPTESAPQEAETPNETPPAPEPTATAAISPAAPPSEPEPQRTRLPLVGWAVLGLVTTGIIIVLLLAFRATTLKTIVTITGSVLLPVIVILVAAAFLIPIARALSVISNIDIEYRPSRSTGRESYLFAVRQPRRDVEAAPDGDD